MNILQHLPKQAFFDYLERYLLKVVWTIPIFRDFMVFNIENVVPALGSR
ncbi:hypothetical protein [Hwangdonia lutea]|uniref:Uncharacterized protein n=1 Tax=Hwangdonia lutea TaxID=3075823 RepID=A0AA97HQW9_9FLAO|nr:hypothetical protein [Hwangdonia sp. SCSIO 19198]WOD42828.1 hypothetical protein RNZ46_12595 [Hwangdonia sp. SCSIO 19198]